jgi:hypothetical protein
MIRVEIDCLDVTNPNSLPEAIQKLRDGGIPIRFNGVSFVPTERGRLHTMDDFERDKRIFLWEPEVKP